MMHRPILDSSPAGGETLFRPWGEYTIEGSGTLAVRVGPLSLWFRVRGNEIWIAHTATGEGAPEPKDEEAWTRWAAVENPRTVRLLPVFPDRPVVVEPELKFKLLTQAQARIFVRVPLWVRVEVGNPGVTLIELPTLEMSDTWFGGFMDGELCYWLPTTARREVTPELFQDHLALCPIQLVNQSIAILNVEKIALRVVHLSLFSSDGGFWADETRVRYQGDEEGSQIDMSGRAPAEAVSASLTTRPRVTRLKTFGTRTFARLRALSGFGSAL